MRHRAFATALGTLGVVAAAALGQAPGNPNFGAQGPGAASANPAIQARVETADLNLVLPDRYGVPVVLEPNRKIFLMAPTDGVLKSVSTPVGTTVRENQEIAQLDRLEAAARVKIAEAEVKEAQALASSEPQGGVAQARVEAARARAELAQIELDRCTLRAPFAGKILAAPVSPGQYVSKGNTLAELGDYSILKVLVPVDRTQVKEGNEINLVIEGKPVTGQVMAMVPLPEMYAPLRELATPWAGAWVNINNSSNALEPGQRVRGPYTPTQPITSLPTRAVTVGEGDTGIVQIARVGTVLDIPVKIVGDAGFDRTQVTGPFLPTDVAIVSSTVPMVAGTVIRFSGEQAVSGASALNAGSLMDVTPPVGGPVSASTGTGIAPIGSPNATPAGTTTRPAPGRPTTKAAPKTTTPPKATGRPF